MTFEGKDYEWADSVDERGRPTSHLDLVHISATVGTPRDAAVTERAWEVVITTLVRPGQVDHFTVPQRFPHMDDARQMGETLMTLERTRIKLLFAID